MKHENTRLFNQRSNAPLCGDVRGEKGALASGVQTLLADLLKRPARGSNRPSAGTPEFFGVRNGFFGLWPACCRPDGRDVWYCGLFPESSPATLSYSIPSFPEGFAASSRRRPHSSTGSSRGVLSVAAGLHGPQQGKLPRFILYLTSISKKSNPGRLIITPAWRARPGRRRSRANPSGMVFARRIARRLACL